MIVIDTSALVAIFRQERERDHFGELIASSDRRFLPAHVYLEYVMVTSSHTQARPWLDVFITRMRLAHVEISSTISHLAADAFLLYGKGRGHPARLNFADCLSYAVAKHLEVPLLYKGGDFIHTDIESALPA